MMLSNQIPTRPAPLSQDTDGPETFLEIEISLDSNAACPEAKDTTELRPNEPDHYAVPPYRESLTVYCVYQFRTRIHIP